MLFKFLDSEGALLLLYNLVFVVEGNKVEERRREQDVIAAASQPR